MCFDLFREKRICCHLHEVEIMNVFWLLIDDISRPHLHEVEIMNVFWPMPGEREECKSTWSRNYECVLTDAPKEDDYISTWSRNYECVLTFSGAFTVSNLHEVEIMNVFWLGNSALKLDSSTWSRNYECVLTIGHALWECWSTWSRNYECVLTSIEISLSQPSTWSRNYECVLTWSLH